MSLATHHGADVLWTRANVRRMLPRALPTLARRGLVPAELLGERELRDWIRPDETGNGYHTAPFSGLDVARAIEGLLEGGYEIPERLQKDVARVAGRAILSGEEDPHTDLARVALRLPAISAGNIRNIAHSMFEAASNNHTAENQARFEEVLRLALGHERAPASLGATLAGEKAPPAALRALASVERWRDVPAIRSVLLASPDAGVALRMLSDAALTRDEFAVLFERAARGEPASTLDLIEKERLSLLQVEDLAPLLAAVEQEIRVRAMTQLSLLRGVVPERALIRTR